LPAESEKNSSPVPTKATRKREALALVPPGGRLDVLATYTAMLELREMVAARAGTQHYWEAPP